MRAEQEIKERIDAVDGCFVKWLRGRKVGDIPIRAFEELYSDAWEEEVALYWTLGMSRGNAARLVGRKFMRMSDELKKQ